MTTEYCITILFDRLQLVNSEEAAACDSISFGL